MRNRCGVRTSSGKAMERDVYKRQVSGNAVGTQHLCGQTYLGHNGLPLRDTPRNHIGSHGALLHYGDGNLSEAFQQQKD